MFPGGCTWRREQHGRQGAPRPLTELTRSRWEAPPPAGPLAAAAAPSAMRGPWHRCFAWTPRACPVPRLFPAWKQPAVFKRCGLLSGSGLPGTPSSRLTGAASPNGGGSLAWDRLFPRGPARAPHSRRERKHKRGQGGRGEGRSRSRCSACTRETVRQKNMLTGIKRNFKKENEHNLPVAERAGGGREAAGRCSPVGHQVALAERGPLPAARGASSERRFALAAL